MIEFLILYELSKKTLTMYGVSKEIKNEFAVLTSPSFGTIKPALNRLEINGFVKSQRHMTSGGRPSTYYSLTKDGELELKRIILEIPPENPIQFLPLARIKLTAANLLNINEQKELFKNIKDKCSIIIAEINRNLSLKDGNFYYNMVFDNLLCEYKNLILLLEALERAGKN